MSDGHDIADAALRSHRQLQQLILRRWAELPYTCPELAAALAKVACRWALTMADGDSGWAEIPTTIERFKKGPFRVRVAGFMVHQVYMTELVLGAVVGAVLAASLLSRGARNDGGE